MVRYLEVIWLDVTIFTSYLGRNCRPDERMCKSSPKVISRKILSLLEVEEDLLQLNLGGVVTGDNLGWNTIWNKVILIIINGFPGSPVVKKKKKTYLPMQATQVQSIGKICRQKWQPTAVFFPEESHGQRSLAGYSPWGHKRVGYDLTT